MKRVREAVEFPLGDPTWLSKIGYWWLFYILYITSPAIFGHYFALVKQTIDDPTDETLPTFDNLWELWKSGFVKLFAAGLPMMGLAMLNMACVGTAMGVLEQEKLRAVFPIFMVIHFLIAVGMMVTWPAFIVQMVNTGQWNSVFRLGEVWQIITANFGGYLLLSIGFPFLGWLAMIATALTGIGLLLWIPGLPILMLAHARLTGLYYYHNCRETV